MSIATVPHFRLAAFYFAYYAVLGAFTPYFSLFLQDRGLGAFAISAILALWYGTRIVAPTTWSWLATRSSRPVIWLRIGALLSLIAFAGFVLPLDFAGLFAVMLVYSFCFNAIMPQFEAMTLSHLGEQREHYGPIRVWGSIGFIVVTAGYGWLLDYVSIATLPWLMLPMFVAVCWTSLINDYGPANLADDGKHTLHGRLRLPEVRVLFILAFLMQASYGPLYVFFSLFLEQQGYSRGTIGVFWAVGVLAEIVVFFKAAALLRRYSAQSVIVLAFALGTLRWIAIGLFPDQPLILFLAQVSHAITFGAFHAACMNRMSELFPGRLNGHGQGILYGFSFGLGGVVAALLAGWAWDLGGGRAAFLIAAAVSAAGAMLAWRVWERSRAASIAGLPAASAATD